VSTSLADSPPAPDSEQPSAPERTASAEGDFAPPSAPGRTCTSCDAPVEDGQQWCMHCGAAQPGSLGERTNWRALTALALLATFLVAGAAVAVAAALSGKGAATKTVPIVLARVPTPVTPGPSTPGATTPTPTTSTPAPAPAPKPGATTSTAPSSSNPLFPPTPTKPPKIPAPVTTPKSSSPIPGGSTTTPSETVPNTTTTESKTTSSPQAEQPSAILLDTDAASTYNPYHVPEADFGDPALAIDGEASTAWTAQVDPSVAPRMAEGLLIDIKSPTKLGSVKIRTTTPGMTVQIYGASGSKAPAAITDPGWTQLSSTHVLKQKTQRLKIDAAGKRYRFVLVWLVKAPGANGSGQTPTRVSLNEVELFPPAG
jgi:hypothetical protein